MLKKIMWLILTVCILGFAMNALVPRAKAVTRNITLYGHFTQGWGFTSGNMTNPGPTISVDQNDVINLTLISQDGLSHQFYVDYNGNGFIDGGEPASPFFSTTINYQFTVTMSGTFTYYCSLHQSTMRETFTSAPIPEFQPELILPLLAIATLFAVVLIRKRST